MSNIIVSRLQDLSEVVTGGGTITYTSSGTAICTDSGASQSAYLRAHVPASPGSTITVKLEARKISGDPNLIIDVVDQNQSTLAGLGNSVQIADPDWSTYELKVTMRSTVFKGGAFLVNFGVFTAQAGSVEIGDVTIKLEDDALGFARGYAFGLIVKNEGGIYLAQNYATHNITQLIQDDVAKAIYVRTQQNYSPTGTTVKILPIPNVQFVAGGSVIPNVIPSVGLYNAAERRWEIKFFDPSTGTIVDIPSVNFNLYFSVVGR